MAAHFRYRRTQVFDAFVKESKTRLQQALVLWLYVAFELAIDARVPRGVGVPGGFSQFFGGVPASQLEGS